MESEFSNVSASRSLVWTLWPHRISSSISVICHFKDDLCEGRDLWGGAVFAPHGALEVRADGVLVQWRRNTHLRAHHSPAEGLWQF